MCRILILAAIRPMGYKLSCCDSKYLVWVRTFYLNQGRNWLPKTGWASSNAARRRFWQNLGGQLPTLPTRHLRPCKSILVRCAMPLFHL